VEDLTGSGLFSMSSVLHVRVVLPENKLLTLRRIVAVFSATLCHSFRLLFSYDCGIKSFFSWLCSTVVHVGLS
jgi:hypothetical protein